MSLMSTVSTWVELIAGVLLVVMGAVRWFVADPPGPAWFRGTGSREVRRQRGRANVLLGLGFVLLGASSFATAANRPLLGAPMTLAAIVLMVTAVVLSVRATKLERSEPPSA
ncbi:MAG TPA: hypothetical protein VL595_10115 [Pseudonocardia sp.]|jgi:hypothetical protein|nr:hypothetical protein [Pseudonocardia sp.]